MVYNSDNIDKALNVFKSNRNINYGTGMYFAKKCRQDVPYANIMELIFMYWLDKNPNVVSYQYENLDIPYKYDGTERHYHPDFDVVLRDFRVIWELKYNYNTGGGKTVAKKHAAEEFATKNGYKEYKIITFEDVRDLVSL